MTGYIENNPFRILGVYSNATLREITANKTKLAAYAKVGRDVAFDADMNLLLPAMSRTLEVVEKAFADLTLPMDKIKYALFWFVKDSAIDEMALEYVKTGNNEKALELLEKKENWSSLINRGVLLFAQGNINDAIGVVLNVIHNDEFRRAMLLAICGETFTVDCKELSGLFVDALKTKMPERNLASLLVQNGYGEEADALKDDVVGSFRAKINGEINKANQVDENDAEASYHAGVALMENTKQSLEELKNFLGGSDMKYQTIVNNVAKQILQLSINYHNSAGPQVDYDKAITLIEYAESIAEGKVLKDRCADNARIMKGNKEHLKVRGDEDALFAILVASKKNAASLKSAKKIVDDCLPILQKIKGVLGGNNKHYLQISSSVANCALGMLVTVVNDSQKSDGKRKQRSVVEEAMKVMELIGKLDMTIDARTHFNQNNSTLEDINAHQILNKKSFWEVVFGSVLFSLIAVIVGGGLFAGIISAICGEGFKDGFVIGCILGGVGLVFGLITKR